MSGSDLDPSLLAAIQEAVAAGMAAQAPLPLAPPPGPALQMTTTPKLGLKLPALDDPALVTDLNDNAVILDDAITATVTATLYNKTLDAPVINNPTINGWTNAAHTHLNAASGGGLDGLAITSGYTGTGNLLRESATALLDPVVRDSIGWGAQPAGAVDTYLERVLAGRLRLTGSGAEQATAFEARATTVSTLSTTVGRFGQAAVDEAFVALNARRDEAAATWRPDDITKPARTAVANVSGFYWYDAVGADPLVWRQRMALDGLGNLGLGVNPAAWGATFRAAQVGQAGALWAPAAGDALYVSSNTYYDGTNRRSLTASGSTELVLSGGVFQVFTAPSVAAGAIVTPTQRLGLDPTGTLTLTPDAGQAALVATGIRIQQGSGSNGELISDVGALQLHATSGIVHPRDDGTTDLGAASRRWRNLYAKTLTLTPDAPQPSLALNANPGIIHTAPGGSLILRANGGYNIYVNPTGNQFIPEADNTIVNGFTGSRWAAVYAVNGTIQTSAAEMKQAITPLDPAACAQAVLDTDWVAFEYKSPTLAKDGDAEAHAKLLEETAPARRQKGFVLGSPDHRVSDLFGLADRKSASPGSDLAVVACALQDALKRIATLEARLRERAPRPRREAA